MGGLGLKKKKSGQLVGTAQYSVVHQLHHIQHISTLYTKKKKKVQLYCPVHHTSQPAFKHTLIIIQANSFFMELLSSSPAFQPAMK